VPPQSAGAARRDPSSHDGVESGSDSVRPAPTDRLEALWSVVELARYLGLSVKGVYGMAENRKLPSLKVGGRLRFDPAEIRAWLRKHAR
jgi:excisionase family DNA binding protein